MTDDEIRALWPREDWQDPWPKDGTIPGYIGEYDPIIARIVPDVFMFEKDRDYQGDTFVLGRGPDGGFVWLEFGWGSCSGCDALQACSSIDELRQLIERMDDSAKRWTHPAEALDWFQTHDWEGDWMTDTKRRAVARATAILETEALR